MKYLILTMLLSSCGNTFQADVVYKTGPKQQPDERKTEIDPRLKEYYTLFDEITGINAEHIPAEIIDLPDTVAGRCTYYRDWQLIQIDTEYYAKSTDNEREQVMLHELGHCALFRDHSDELMDDDVYGGIPASIMYAYTIGDYEFYEKNKEHYHEELNSD